MAEVIQTGRKTLWEKEKLLVTSNFKLDENGRKLSKRVENTVGKGESAHNKQFLLFPQCFQKACFPGASKGVIVWEWVKMLNKPIIHLYPRILTQIIVISRFPLSTALQERGQCRAKIRLHVL